MPPGRYTPEPRYLGQPLGALVEGYFFVLIGYSLYMAVILARDFFPHIHALDMDVDNSEIQCPRGYSVTRYGPVPACRASLGLAVKAAGPLNGVLLVAGMLGLFHILLRKARDAGVTLTLPWSPIPAARRRENGDRDGDDHPAAERPRHTRIQWWVEPVLIAHACTAILVFLTLSFRLVTHPRRLSRSFPHCDSGWQPQWLWQWSEVGYECQRTSTALLLCFFEMGNALVAAGLNALAVKLTRQRKAEEDNARWL